MEMIDKPTVMEIAVIEIFCSYHVNKLDRCLSHDWSLSLLHYSVIFNISWQTESVNYLLDLT